MEPFFFYLWDFEEKGCVLRMKNMRKNFRFLLCLSEHLRAGFGPLHLTALEISMGSYLHSMVQHKI